MSTPERADGHSRPTSEWLTSGEYLPDFMRDFHDQKEVFKALQEVVERRNAKQGSYTEGLTWVAAHVYTVDVFLWIMARHGYTLQRSRKRVPFSDLSDWLAAEKRQRDEAMARVVGLTPLSNPALADVAPSGAALQEREGSFQEEPKSSPSNPTEDQKQGEQS